MQDNKLKCVDCGGEIKKQTDFCCAQCGRVYNMKNEVINALPINLNKLSAQEAKYHNEFSEDPVEVHQLNSFRVNYLHRYIWQQLRQLKTNSDILEIGAGSCYDAKQLEEKYNLTLTDISVDSLCRAKTKLSSANNYLAVDGLNLPFIPDSYLAVYMVAVLHHFTQPTKVIEQIEMVLKSGGLLVIGIEPNKTYFKLIKKNRMALCKATHMQGVEISQADADMEGFSYSDWLELFPSNKWKDLQIKPVWIFSGWLHYGLEFIFRIFKLKKRLVLPKILEKIIMLIDETLLKLPLLKYLGWHWIITVRKK